MVRGVYFRTKENRLNLSLSHKGKKFPNRKSPPPFTQEHRDRINEKSKGTQFKKGHVHSPETIEKLRKSHLGLPSGNKGNKYSKEVRLKMSQLMKIRFEDETRHPNWKGEEVGYRALHVWVVKMLGQPKKCEHCLKTDLKFRQYHWANKSHKYKRDLTDWIRLCAKCHKKYDKVYKINK